MPHTRCAPSPRKGEGWGEGYRAPKMTLLRAPSARVDFRFDGTAPAPSEQPLDVGELELDVGRPAVVALAGIGRRLHLAQQRVHLLGLEAAAGAHRAVAGHGGGDVHQAPLERQRLVPFRHVIGEVVHEGLGVDLAEQRRGLAHRHRARPERLDTRP